MIASFWTRVLGFFWLCFVIRVVVIVVQLKESVRVLSPPQFHRALRFLGNLYVFWCQPGRMALSPKGCRRSRKDLNFADAFGFTNRSDIEEIEARRKSMKTVLRTRKVALHTVWRFVARIASPQPSVSSRGKAALDNTPRGSGLRFKRRISCSHATQALSSRPWPQRRWQSWWAITPDAGCVQRKSGSGYTPVCRQKMRHLQGRHRRSSCSRWSIRSTRIHFRDG